MSRAFAMGWKILWALVLSFTLSGIVQAVVTKSEMVRLLPDSRPRTILVASALGAASSSCSYAAVALARSIFRKGGDFTAAMAFQFASTNPVLELGVTLAALMGWQFTAAEFVGGPAMIVFLVLLLRATLRPRIVETARAQAEREVAGRMEGHGGMDISLSGGTALFLSQHPKWAKLVGPLIGPLVAVLSFVCSVGNVPLATVLWNGGISFGGVVAFLFADLIVLPVVNIYRKYYGNRMATLLFDLFYVAMAAAGYVVEVLFGLLGLVSSQRGAVVLEAQIQWNYTTVLNILILQLSAVLFWRFFLARVGRRCCG